MEADLDQAAIHLSATQIKFLEDYLGVKLNSTPERPQSTDHLHIDELIKRLAAQPGKGEEEPLKATVLGLLGTLPGDLNAAKGLNAELAESLQSLLSSGARAAQAQDFQTALDYLNKCAEHLAKNKSAARAGDAATAIPEGTVHAKVSALEASFAMVKTQRLRSVAGLDELIKTLQAEEDRELHDIARIIEGLRKNLPDALEDHLTHITTALHADDAEAVKSEAARATLLVAQAEGYLKDNQQSLELCEDNPFDLKLDVIAPLSQALQAVRQSLSRI